MTRASYGYVWLAVRICLACRTDFTRLRIEFLDRSMNETDSPALEWRIQTNVEPRWITPAHNHPRQRGDERKLRIPRNHRDLGVLLKPSVEFVGRVDPAKRTTHHHNSLANDAHNLESPASEAFPH